MSAQIQWLIEHELDEARRIHRLEFSNAEVACRRDCYAVVVYYAGQCEFGFSIADAARKLAEKVGSPEALAMKKRIEAEKLLLEASQLEGCAQ